MEDPNLQTVPKPRLFDVRATQTQVSAGGTTSRRREHEANIRCTHPPACCSNLPLLLCYHPLRALGHKSAAACEAIQARTQESWVLHVKETRVHTSRCSIVSVCAHDDHGRFLCTAHFREGKGSAGMCLLLNTASCIYVHRMNMSCSLPRPILEKAVMVVQGCFCCFRGLRAAVSRLCTNGASAHGAPERG